MPVTACNTGSPTVEILLDKEKGKVGEGKEGRLEMKERIKCGELLGESFYSYRSFSGCGKYLGLRKLNPSV